MSVRFSKRNSIKIWGSANIRGEIGIGILFSAVTSDRTPEGALTVAELARKILGLQYSRKDVQEATISKLSFSVLL
jgi:hypothetical protein